MFATQRDEHLVKVPRAALLAAYGFHPMRKVLTEFVAPAPDRLLAYDYSALEEQFLDVAQLNWKRKYHRTAQLMTSAGKR